MKKIIATILTLCMVLGLAGAASAEATTLTMWTFIAQHQEFYESMAKLWNEQNPDRQIDLQVTTIGYDDMHNKYKIALQADEGAPDLCDVGLGYVKLGQPSTQLSGGEAQRVKLATELSRRDTGKTLYVLDEPTTGLHTDDVKRLLEILQRLCDSGSTVLVIEHNLDVIKTADHIIDLGPEGGDGGGAIVVTGTPEEVARCEASYTGQFLRNVLG